MHASLYLYAMAALQGISELFPISSLGHSIVVPELAHWPLDRQAEWFLPFVVVLHLGTAGALVVYFWRDWLQLIRGWVRAGGRASNDDARLMWLLIIGTVPAGLLGVLLSHRIKALFGNFGFAAAVLMLNGLMLLWGDRLKSRRAVSDLAGMSWTRALLIGAAQALALIPGISRSGATLVAGLGLGLEYEAAARFSFLLATPIIGAAGVLEIPKLLHAGVPHELLGSIAAAGLISGACAWASTWLLMRWFHGHEFKALRPFGLYCLAFGAFALGINHFA